MLPEQNVPFKQVVPHYRVTIPLLVRCLYFNTLKAKKFTDFVSGICKFSHFTVQLNCT